MVFKCSGEMTPAIETHPVHDLLNRCFSFLAQMFGGPAEPHVVKEAYRGGPEGCSKTFGEH